MIMELTTRENSEVIVIDTSGIYSLDKQRIASSMKRGAAISSRSWWNGTGNRST